ncbi:MAG: anti-sigma factor family protein [Fidelibacterota bacterium]
MKCDDIRLLMMDALYDEISAGDQEVLDMHLQSCPACRRKYAALRATTEVLGQWEDQEPHVNLTFVNQPTGRFTELIRQLKSWTLAGRLGVATAALLLLLALFNTSIRFSDGEFAFETGLFNHKRIDPADFVTKSDLEQLRRENYQIVSAIIEEYDKRSKIDTAVMLDKFYEELERQREEDLRMVGTVMDQLQYGTAQRLEQTDRTLGTLIEYVSAQSGGR